jgi:hypothetical protein
MKTGPRARTRTIANGSKLGKAPALAHVASRRAGLFAHCRALSLASSPAVTLAHRATFLALAAVLVASSATSLAAERTIGATRARAHEGDAAAVRALANAARPIAGQARDYDALLRAIGDARIVLLGEDTHGTHEHYVERARITERLVAERGFRAVIIEGDISKTWTPRLPMQRGNVTTASRRSIGIPSDMAKSSSDRRTAAPPGCARRSPSSHECRHRHPSAR